MLDILKVFNSVSGMRLFPNITQSLCEHQLLLRIWNYETSKSFWRLYRYEWWMFDLVVALITMPVLCLPCRWDNTAKFLFKGTQILVDRVNCWLIFYMSPNTWTYFSHSHLQLCSTGPYIVIIITVIIIVIIFEAGYFCTM